MFMIRDSKICSSMYSTPEFMKDNTTVKLRFLSRHITMEDTVVDTKNICSPHCTGRIRAMELTTKVASLENELAKADYQFLLEAC